jgi:hypothetical protein
MYGRAPSWHPHAVPPAPCDTCNKFDVCKRESLACPAFSEYVNEGEPDLASNVPSRAIYLQIFSGEDNGS